MEADFSGYATVHNLKCTDGRTIKPGAFTHNDKMQVPLVWRHKDDEPRNVLGHVTLESRAKGIYAYGYFNETPDAQHVKTLVKHRDIRALSIRANELRQVGQDVIHGNIQEVSLVLFGANPGAYIDNINLQHSDDADETHDGEAIIYTGLEFEHQDTTGDTMADKADEKTVKDVFESMTEEQQNVVYYMIGQALEGAGAGDGEAKHEDSEQGGISVDELTGQIAENIIQHLKEDQSMTRNVFDQSEAAPTQKRQTLTHEQIQTIVNDGVRLGSLKEGVLLHAQEYGIEDIDFLFPDAKTITDRPDLIARRTEWVKGVIDGAKHSPFARIKSIGADITAEEARAKGYVKGSLKKDEIIKLLRRVTTPTTVFKKNKLDRDDVVDITDFDVVAWLKWEIRFMLEEELARAILVGDGREPDDEDKIDEDKLRPIAWDNELYAHSVTIPANTTAEGYVESFLRARKHYKGTGTPTLYTTDDILTDMILLKDKLGRRLYPTEAELAAALRVANIVVVEVMETIPDLIGILVNMVDYTIGADKGGELSFFEDFDIDYNQQKYLLETRVSGALTKFKSAVVVKRTSGTTVTPLVPAFNPATHTITVPTVMGVSYFNVTNPLAEVALTNGASVVITVTTDVEARPNPGYNFPHNFDADWTFAYTA